MRNVLKRCTTAPGKGKAGGDGSSDDDVLSSAWAVLDETDNRACAVKGLAGQPQDIVGERFRQFDFSVKPTGVVEAETFSLLLPATNITDGQSAKPQDWEKVLKAWDPAKAAVRFSPGWELVSPWWLAKAHQLSIS